MDLPYFKPANIKKLIDGEEGDYALLKTELESIKRSFSHINDKNISAAIDSAINSIDSSLNNRKIISAEPKSIKYCIFALNSYSFLTKDKNNPLMSVYKQPEMFGAKYEFLNTEVFKNNAMLFNTKKAAIEKMKEIEKLVETVVNYFEDHGEYPSFYLENEEFWKNFVKVYKKNPYGFLGLSPYGKIPDPLFSVKSFCFDKNIERLFVQKVEFLHDGRIVFLYEKNIMGVLKGE